MVGVYTYMNGVYTPFMYVYVLYRKTLAVYTDSVTGRFFFLPVILNFFSSKNSPFLCGRSRQSTRCSSPLHIKYNSKPMMNNLFHFVIGLRSASGSGAFVGLQGGLSWILPRHLFSSSTTQGVPSRSSRTLGLIMNLSIHFFFFLHRISMSSPPTATMEASFALGMVKAARE